MVYNLGHMIEGAIAHYQATGKKELPRYCHKIR